MTAGASGHDGATVLDRRVATHRAVVVLGVALTLIFVLVDLFDVLVNAPTLRLQVGVDYHLYIDTASRWLSDGTYFQPYQLAGPYQISAGDILYPPVALLLFVSFTFLPAVLWWLLPAAALSWSLRRLRPAPAIWPMLAACATWPTTPLKILTGNPVIWVVGALGIGVLYAWPSVLVLIKPSLFPFALFGARSRRWWLALAVFVAIGLPFGSLWLDWVHSILNSRGGGIGYSILEIPMVAFPVLAWVGRKRAQA